VTVSVAEYIVSAAYAGTLSLCSHRRGHHQTQIGVFQLLICRVFQGLGRQGVFGNFQDHSGFVAPVDVLGMPWPNRLPRQANLASPECPATAFGLPEEVGEETVGLNC